MALQKQPVNINFSQGLNLKTDPKQVPIGQFLELKNSIFTKQGLFQKRNGFGYLPALPDTSSKFLTTFNDNLTAIGTNIQALNQGSNTWVNKGNFQNVGVSTLSLIRSGTNQIQCDSAVSSNGLVCTVYTDNVPSAGSNVAIYKYAVADATTGQNIVAPTVIASCSSSPRVFFLGTYFVIAYPNGTNLQYIAVSAINPSIPNSSVVFSNQFNSTGAQCWDGFIANNNLYFGYSSTTGNAFTYIDSILNQHGTVVVAGQSALIMTVSADTTQISPNICFVFNLSGTPNIVRVKVYDSILSALDITDFNATVSAAPLNITCTVKNPLIQIYVEITNNYSYDSGVPTHFIQTFSGNISTGSVGGVTVFKRSVGLASKAILLNGITYFLVTYSSVNQPTYFLVNGSATILAKIAYSNGGGYLTLGLPSMNLKGSILQTAYLFKDLVEAVTKTTSTSNTSGIYAQTGINLLSLNFAVTTLSTTEIADNLNLAGGFLSMYDGYQIVEQGFHVWPDSIEATWSTTGGAIAAQPDGTTNTNAYFYQVTYEWTDNQGNIFRSAPSIPISVTTTGSASTGSITVHIPTLRLTAKTQNPVNLVIYRWSVAQQVYHQVTSITIPTQNDPTTDSIDFVDKLADASIVGNNIIYTTGGVVEDIGPPATEAMTLFRSRMFLIDAEDPNLLWYSKQVIEATPVEFSDLFTIYVSPTTGSQGSTGPMKCLFPMDDKLIIFKQDAIYYLTGTGPDNTGANNDFSEPIFITSTVGSVNQASIVFIPQGLMFQSDKGIWLLGRDLSTNYIGAPVEDFNSATVLSAIAIPGTNQVRFTLNMGVTLMYDYFYNQWGTFTGIPSISSTLYHNEHTFINSLGQVLQETPGVYLDGTNPVLMSFKTGWIKLAGLQDYQRFYDFYFLGEYLSPHKLVANVAYNYAPFASQQVVISPNNFNASWGGDSTWGASSPWGGNASLEFERIHTQRQLCESFQIGVSELFDSTYNTPAGAGFTMSGILCRVGFKRIGQPIRAANTVG